MTDADAVVAFNRKIDLFLRLHILPTFTPERIHWWFSLSGGKDSFAMAEGIRQWYADHGLRLTASAFSIDQWGGVAPRSIGSQLGWVDVETVDGRLLTQELTGYSPGEQAPCRSCADARRQLSDDLLARRAPRAGFVTFLARGLHLSDTAASLAWRFALGRDPAGDMITQGKAKPIVALRPDVYLVKPLAYAREFESEHYAQAAGYRRACCGCPACQFPSRRDIVEETLLLFYKDPLWEFRVPGVRQVLAQFGAPNVEFISAPGVQAKQPHLPPDFGAFAVAVFRQLACVAQVAWGDLCDTSIDLDRLGAERLRYNAPLHSSPRPPLPALLRGRDLDPPEERMIATMGPFWGAVALAPALAARAWELQRQYFGLSCDPRWTQVTPLLRQYYAQRRVIPHPRSPLVVNASQHARCSATAGGGTSG